MGHQLHQAYSSGRRYGTSIEDRLCLDDGKDELRRDLVNSRGLLHVGEILAHPGLQVVRDEFELDLLAHSPHAVRGRVALRRLPGSHHIPGEFLDVRLRDHAACAGHPDLVFQVTHAGNALPPQQEGESLRQESLDLYGRILKEDGSDGTDLEKASSEVDPTEERELDWRALLPRNNR